MIHSIISCGLDLSAWYLSGYVSFYTSDLPDLFQMWLLLGASVIPTSRTSGWLREGPAPHPVYRSIIVFKFFSVSNNYSYLITWYYVISRKLGIQSWMKTYHLNSAWTFFTNRLVFNAFKQIVDLFHLLKN